MESAEKNKSHRETDTTKQARNRLSEENIESIHSVFIETGGCVRETAKRIGFGRSTVSRYARARGWREELRQIDPKPPDQKTENSHVLEEEITAKLEKMRQLLFNEIMGDENSEPIDGSSLKIAPRTLSEIVKALIDVDKRISEREEKQPDAMSDPYQIILARCAKIVDTKSLSEKSVD